MAEASIQGSDQAAALPPEGVHAADAVKSERPSVEHGVRLAVVAVSVILATLLEMIDTTIVNVALPNIQGNLGATIDEGTYVVTGYIVASVVIVPLTPWLQARFGLKRYYLASILIFTAASVMCGLSGSFTELVIWRIIQGIGGGGLISTSQTILRDVFPDDKQGAAQGIFALGVIIGPTLGPLIGGYITDNLDWRWCFFVNAPLGLIATLLVVSFLRELERPRRLSLDGVGLVLLTVGLGSMQFVLDQGERKDWFSDGSILSFSALAIIGIATFIVWELRGARSPIVDLRVLRHPGVWGGSLLGATVGLALYGSLIILPQYTQTLLGFTALLSGQLISVRAVAMACLMPLGVKLATGGRLDPRIQIGAGMALLGTSGLMLASVTTSDTPFGALTLSLIVAGFGLSQIFVPLQLSIFAGLDQSEVPKAASFFNLARQLGGSVATALLVTLLDRKNAQHQTTLAGSVTLASSAANEFLRVHGGPTSRALGELTHIVATQASALAYADVARISAYVTLLLTPFVLVLRRSSAPVNLAKIEH